MRKSWALIIVAILVISFAMSGFAADMPATKATKTTTVTKTRAAATTTKVIPATKPSTYPPGPIQKAERGFTNLVFGWTEIPKRIVDKTKEYNNPIKGFVLGTFQGTCKAFARTASGASELATFPIGRYDKPQVMPDMPAAK